MAFKQTPKQFPGARMLPRPVQSLVETLFPPDQIPMPGAAIKPTLGPGQMLPSARDAVEMLKRLQGGLSKVPTAGAKAVAPQVALPPAAIQPSALETLDEAVSGMGKQIAPWQGLQNIRSILGF